MNGENKSMENPPANYDFITFNGTKCRLALLQMVLRVVKNRLELGENQVI